MSAYLPKWLIKTMLRRSHDYALLEIMLQPFDANALDRVTDDRIKSILFWERLRRASEPYLRIFKLVGEIIHGRYWRASKEVRSNPDPASGAGSGATGQPVAQFTSGYAFAPGANPVTFATAPNGPGGIVTAPTPDFEDAGIRAGEVVAYRGWRLHDGKLYSVFKSQFCWEPKAVVDGNSAAGDGVHAFKSLLLLSEYGSGYSWEPIVTGTVWLWGEVYEHERGYRASKAAIRSIDDSPDYDAKALRKLYGLTRSRKKKQ